MDVKTDAILTYRHNGSKSVCGQQIGANGGGMYAVFFEGFDSDKVEAAAYDYIKKLNRQMQYSGQITEIHLVFGEGYYGNFIKRVEV